MNIVSLGTFLGSVAALITAIGSRGKQRSHIRKLEEKLRAETKARHECQDRISALETEMVTLRKLLPGGEWFVKLGLPDPS